MFVAMRLGIEVSLVACIVSGIIVLKALAFANAATLEVISRLNVLDQFVVCTTSADTIGE